jgi:polysaccharide export outer membrane protein
MLQSCVQHRDLINFQEDDPAVLAEELIQNIQELRIQSHDILKIDVSSLNPDAVRPFKSTEEESLRQASQDRENLLLQGYEVDSLGFVNFPLLGRVEVSGNTISEATQVIENRVRQYVKDAVVNVRLLNFRFSVLGEVNLPGMQSTYNNRVTLLDALSMAGDLSSYANRTNILLIREIDGERTFRRLNLQTSEIFQSDFYYIKQNDIIYVEPIKVKTATVADPVNRYISYSSGILAIIALILSIR